MYLMFLGRYRKMLKKKRPNNFARVIHVIYVIQCDQCFERKRRRRRSSKAKV